MKKRLISLVLIVMTLFSVMLTSCSSTTSDADAKDKINEEASRGTTTLNMYVVTEKETTADAAAAVAARINKLTKAKFKTQLNIYFYTEDKYYDMLEQKIEAIEAEIVAEEEARKLQKQLEKEAKARGETIATTTVAETEETEEETVLNEWGLSELKYPEESSRQIDIIFFSGYDRYKDYIERDILSRLDDELSAGSKKLKDYINPAFLDAAAIDGSVYAIPNNHVIGEYTYLLVNKELAAKYSYDVADFVDVPSCVDFVADIAKYEPNVAPICGTLGLTNIKYISLDHKTLDFIDTPSVLAGNVAKGTTLGSRVTMRNIFAIRQYTQQMIAMKTFEEKGYYRPEAKLEDDFGIAVIKGGAELAAIYGDKYEMIALENPMATEDILYEGMFGVTNYTKDLTRSMEIITYLNTNAELRNLLQYGIENVNYTVNEDGSITRLNKSYMMDLNKTGNVFMAYPEEGMPLDAWDWGKKQNIDARVDPYLGFTYVDTGLDMTMIEKIEALSKDYFARMEACKTVEELTVFLDTAYEELQQNADMKMATNFTDQDKSPNYIYSDWFTTNWPSEEG